MRHIFVVFINFFSLSLILVTELLSKFDLITKGSIQLFWIIFFIFLIIYFLLNYKNQFFFKLKIIHKILFQEKLIIIPIIIVLIFTFLISLFYVPGTPDAMSYHLTRVMVWAQNHNINLFSTPDQRMLFMPPFSGFLNLHIYLFFENKFFFNFVQWISMFSSIILVSLIAKELKGSLKVQLLASFFLATLPMGILQSTSTQTDYVISFWFLSFLYFLIKYKNNSNLKNIFFLSTSLGIGILSKQTMFFFSLPFIILFYFIIKKESIKITFFHFIISILILITINLGYLKRTYDIYGNFTGFHENNVSATNETFKPKYLVSNIVRNISLNLTLPNKDYNQILRDGLKNIHESLDISITDQKNTFGKDFFIYFNTYESHAPNTLHFVTIVLIFITLLFPRVSSKEIKIYILGLILGFVIFSFILKWQPTGNRLLLPFFSASSVLFGFFLLKLKNKKIQIMLIVLIFLWSLPYLFINHTRPLLAYNNKDIKKIELNFKPFLKTIENPEYFYSYNDKYSHETFNEISNLIFQNNCKYIGITRGYSEYEYPLRHYIMNKYKNTEVEIIYPYVRNLSRNLDNINYKKLCAVVVFGCDETDINCTSIKNLNLPNKLKKISFENKVILYL